MVTEGKPLGWAARDEREHFVRCPGCGEWVDMRDLAEALEHLHGKEIEEKTERSVRLPGYRKKLTNHTASEQQTAIPR
ncbi:hypothetical protein [Bradyrhizobium tunisiense]|uniref:hypothetical protein n=1 Tax=Bradyrhizobium tunisiense TaxID=3278709 RepID=UPI0035D6D472